MNCAIEGFHEEEEEGVNSQMVMLILELENLPARIQQFSLQ